MKIIIRVLFTILLILPSILTLASELPFTPGSPRSHGMGNIQITVASLEDAQFFNPAFFALDKSEMNILRVDLGFNKNGLDIFGDLGKQIRDASSQNDISQVPTSLLNELINFDAKYNLSGPLFLGYNGNGFSVGVYNTAQGSLIFNNAAIPTADMFLNLDFAVITGFGFSIYGNKQSKKKLLVGINFKYVNRVQFEENDINFLEVGKYTNPFKFSSDFKIGQGIGSDIGFILQHNKISVGAVIYDWFGMTFSWKKYNSSFTMLADEIPTTKVNTRIGGGISYQIGTILGIPEDIISHTIIVAEVQGFLNEENSFFNMIHLGFETRILHIFDLRAGINGGYPSIGLSFSLFNLIQLEYSYYSEEDGTMPSQKQLSFHEISLTIKI